MKEIEKCKPFTSVKLRTKQRFKRLWMPPVGEAMDHQHFLTAPGEYAAGLELAFLSGNVTIPENLNIHAFLPSNITSSTFSKRITKDLHNCAEICTRIYVAALFVIVRSWKQAHTHCAGSSSINYWYTREMKCYEGAVKMSEVVRSGRKECPSILVNEKSKLPANMWSMSPVVKQFCSMEDMCSHIGGGGAGARGWMWCDSREVCTEHGFLVLLRFLQLACIL